MLFSDCTVAPLIAPLPATKHQISQIGTLRCTSEVTGKTCTGSGGHRLVLQALCELRRPLHLVLQSLKGVLCFRTKW